MRILIVDNYDSFTFNLFHLAARVTGTEPIVVRNDQMEWGDLRDLRCDAVILSPGPGRPDKRADFGICSDVVAESLLPVLGVCLGHQGLAHFFGGAVVHDADPMHGRVSPVYHDGSSLFAGVPQGFKAVRYHSLRVSEPLPEGLERIAWTNDGVLMGLRHRARPSWGVQFHPESICTEYGETIVGNFVALARAHRRPSARPDWSASERAISVVPRPNDEGANRGDLALCFRRLDAFVDPERAFAGLFSEEAASFWLDSSHVETGVARFSFMGGPLGPHGQRVAYHAPTRELTITRSGQTTTRKSSLFSYLDEQLKAHRVALCDDLPFDFTCGFIGYLGYELKADAGEACRHASPFADAQLVLSDRLIAFDHEAKAVYLVALADQTASGQAQVREWFDSMTAQLRSLPSPAPPQPHACPEPLAFRWSRDRARYVRDVLESLRLIRDGETYEVCLTNVIHAETVASPLAFYRNLRRLNPAPHAAYLRFDGMTVASSSPERFLRVDRSGVVETKPIKGTAPRGVTPLEDARLAEHLRTGEKFRSENLMITDLLRNDLGVVCEVGSVEVPRLMHVETFATLHQLVTTIRGKLRRGISAVACVRSAFPGGSMIGAPKVRTMRIIDALEAEARGVYSGAIGYFSVSGPADLSIVNRTAVFSAGAVSIGVGGAIVALSDVDDEFEEIVLKARALIRALLVTAHGEDDVERRLEEVECSLYGRREH